jgi:ABC-type dipeptide/oligopeptide/nickel transport system permease subunit
MLAFVVMATVAPLVAHHSFSEYYVEQDTIEVEGVVVEFQYQNPHSWVHMTGTDPFGRERRYAA